MRVNAYHLIITTYGFWLPNDPRGSWSDFVRAWELFQFGQATTTSKRQSLAKVEHNYTLRQAAKQSLARKPVLFSGVQARAVGRGIANYCERSACIIHACSILTNHTHLVVARQRYSIEQVANLIKGSATRQLADEQLHPFQDKPYRNGRLPTPWARKCWKVFLSDREDIRRAIRYTEDNPVKESKRRQQWPFVVPYDESRLRGSNVALRADR